MASAGPVLMFLLLTAELFIAFGFSFGAKSKLYDPPGHVVVLNSTVFDQAVYNSDKVWFVEFFSSWCGHCVNFAPTWKSFADDLKYWKHVAQVAAVDCANRQNTDLCRQHDVQAYPSMKFFNPFTRFDNLSSSEHYRGARNPRAMRESVAIQIEKQMGSPKLKHWPSLEPANSTWVLDFFNNHHDVQFLVVIFQGSDQFMGKEIILDVSGRKGVVARWMKRAQNPLVLKWGINTFPSVYILDRSGVPTRITSSEDTRTAFTEAIFKHVQEFEAQQPKDKLGDVGGHLKRLGLDRSEEEEDEDHERFLAPGGQGDTNIESDFDGRDVDDKGILDVMDENKEEKQEQDLEPDIDGDASEERLGGKPEGGQGGETGGDGDNTKLLWDRMQAKNKEKAMKRKSNIRQSDKRPSEWPKVYMLDLESAIQYSLRQEVSLRQRIEGDALKALTDYVAVLNKYFPGRAQVSEFLENLHKWLQERQHGSIPIEEWLNAVDPTKKQGSGLPNRLEWIGCQGSEAHFRGYPCGLWTLFHTLTVSQASLIRRYDNISYMEVLHAMRGYILSFFSCQQCRDNFRKEVADVDDSVTSLDSAIMWLWHTHNRVNKRLRGDPSEDPEHPKVSFPPRSICASCYGSTNVEIWEESRVLGFLKEFYSIRNIDFTNLYAREIKENNNDMEQNKERTHITLNPESLRQEVVKRLRQREMDIRLAIENAKAGYFGLGVNGIDLSMCMLLNISCVMLIVCVYFVLVWRKRRSRKVRLLP